MIAQNLYDLRDEYEFCSGEELHEFFLQTVGEPSPSGRVEISGTGFLAARIFVDECYRALIHNNSSERRKYKSDHARVVRALGR